MHYDFLLRAQTTAKSVCRQAGIPLCYVFYFNRSDATLKIIKHHILLYFEHSLRNPNK